MAINTAIRVAGVRFHRVGRLYHFDASAYPELSPGDYVVVETRRGRQLGQIMGFVPPEEADLERLKPVQRPATARDLLMKKLWQAKEMEALIICREAAAGMKGLAGVKFIRAQYNFDGSQLTFLFTTEEENVDVSPLQRRLERKFRSRLEMRRIGARDAAKLLGEYGACGGPRCCSTFLTSFSPISIRMAKAQGISLNPSEITGMCGRLRCCLLYEYEQYVEASKTLPKTNKWVGTPYGEGRVIDRNPLKQTVTVLIDGTRHEVHCNDLTPLEELRALEAKARASCGREGKAGPCECGARVQEGGRSKPLPSAPETPEGQKGKRSSTARRGRSRRRGGRRRGRSRRSDQKTD